MPKKDTKLREELGQVIESLRDPFRMRSAVALVAVLIMFFAISEPLHGRMKRSKRELNQLRERTKTAEEVLLLIDHLESVEPKILRGEGTDVVTGHLIELIRNQDVALQQINAESPQRLGPMQTVRVSLDVSGEFPALNALIEALESQPFLLRVETVQIKPGDKRSMLPMMSLSLRVLKEKS